MCQEETDYGDDYKKMSSIITRIGFLIGLRLAFRCDRGLLQPHQADPVDIWLDTFAEALPATSMMSIRRRHGVIGLLGMVLAFA